MTKLRVSRNVLYGVAALLVLLLAYSMLVPRMGGLKACPLEGRVRLEYFYSETCPACQHQKPIIEDFLKDFGQYVDFVPRCVYIHEGDDALCIQKVGETAFLEAMDRANEISLRATPTIVLGCNNVKVGVQYAEDLKRLACAGLKPRPPVCG